MILRRDALRHSPTLWGMYAAAALSALGLVGVAAWNAYEYRTDIRRWVKL